jgi:hypothetical protein
MSPALRCFVAMAVGHADTNRIYDKHIAPTLRASGIHPVFMGRLEHNDDIDKRIIREIEACDFAIADLTYARPSVYFEADYAQRNVPVIYTSQADHLHPRPDDKFGNFKVHFDLLMRNIIPWRNPKDPNFAEKLARRIRRVVAPMLRQRQSDERIKAEELQFRSLPLVSRLNWVTESFTKTLKVVGYRSLLVKDEINSWVGGTWVGQVPDVRTLNVGVVFVRASFTRREIYEHEDGTMTMLGSRFDSFDDDVEGYNRQRWENQWPRHKVPKAAETKNITKIVARLVLCSLERIPRGRLASALPSYTPNETGQLFTRNTELQINSSRLLPLSTNVYIFDGIKSASDAIKKSRELKLVIKT